MPESLVEGDDIRLRFAAAYADLLHAQGEESLAQEWHDAVTALDPDALADSVEFTELEELEDGESVDDSVGDVAAAEHPDEDAEDQAGAEDADDAEPEADADADADADAELDDEETLEAALAVEFSSAEADGAEVQGADFPTAGRSFQDEVEAEVAELLGETGEATESADGPDSTSS
jgi:hypothetical protein